MSKHTESLFAIWQWGRRLFIGTKAECRSVRDRWANAHGNLELIIRRHRQSLIRKAQ